MRTKDTDWLRQSFMLPANSIVDAEIVRRTMKDARLKFTDSSLGGNFAINPAPQFSPWADISVRSNFLTSNGGILSSGMGRYYSEAIDNNAVLVHMRFGVPKYNSLINYFGSFYNPHAASIANTGRGRGIVFSAARALGHIVTIPLAPLVLANRVWRFFLDKPISKYYYLKPTMPLYYNAVQNILNSLAVNMGIARPASSDVEEELYKGEPHLESGSDVLKRYRNNLSKGPMDFWTDGGTIDIRKVATRAQRLANQQRRDIENIFETAETNEELSKLIIEYINETHILKPNEMRFKTHNDYRDAFFNLMEHSIDDQEQNTTTDYMGSEELEGGGGSITKYLSKVGDSVKASLSSFGEFVEAEFQDGSQFVTFKVDNPGTYSESFSNSTKESGLSQALNSVNSSSRSARFNFADGNTGVAPLDAAIGFGRDVMSGILDGVQLTGLTAFTGNAFADIPKTWDGSTANLPRADYTIELRSPYGNKLSRFMHLYVPLSMLLAGALPLSAGKQSYTSPFICELFCQGRNQIRLGMIESLSITRGAGNIGWTQDGEPLGIDISFSVVDLSTILHVPIHTGLDGNDVTSVLGSVAWMAAGGPFGLVAGASNLINHATAGMLDDDNAFTDYMAVLGGLSLLDQINPYRKLKIAAAKRVTNFETWATSANFANFVMGTPPARTLSKIVLGSGSVLGR